MKELPHRDISDEILLEEVSGVLLSITVMLNIILIFQHRSVDFVSSNFFPFSKARKLMYLVLFAPSLYSFFAFLTLLSPSTSLWFEAFKHVVGGIAVFNFIKVIALSLGGSQTLQVILDSQTSHARDHKEGKLSCLYEANTDYDLYYFYKMTLYLLFFKPFVLALTWVSLKEKVETYNTTLSVFGLFLLLLLPFLCYSLKEMFRLVHIHAGIQNLDQKCVSLCLLAVFMQMQSAFVNVLVWVGAFPEVNVEVQQGYQGAYLLAVMTICEMVCISIINFRAFDPQHLFTAFTSSSQAARDKFLETKLTIN